MSILPFLCFGFLVSVYLASSSLDRRLELESEKFFSHLEGVYIKPIENAIWDFRLSDLENLTATILTIPSFSGVQVRAGESKPIVDLGNMDGGKITKIALNIPKTNAGAWYLITAQEAPDRAVIYISYIKEYGIIFLLFMLIIFVGLVFAFEKSLVGPTKKLRHALLSYSANEPLADIDLQHTAGCAEIIEVISGYNAMISEIKADREMNASVMNIHQSHFDVIKKMSSVVADNQTEVKQNLIRNLSILADCHDVALVILSIESGQNSAIEFFGDASAVNKNLLESQLQRGDLSAIKAGQFVQSGHDFSILLETIDIDVDQHAGGRVIVLLDTQELSIVAAVRLFLNSMVSLNSYALQSIEGITIQGKLNSLRDKVFNSFEAISIGVCLLDENGQVLLKNEQINHYLGLIAGKPLQLESIKQLSQSDGAEAREALKGFNTWLFDSHALANLDLKIGLGLWLSFSKFHLDDNSIMLQIRDTTLEKEKIERDKRREKLEAIGSVSARITHDFNNFLQSIQGNMELIKLSKNLTPDIDDYLNESIEVCQSAKKLGQQLLEYIGESKAKVNPEYIDINALLYHFDKTVQSSYPLELQFNYQVETDKSIFVDLELLKRSLFNIVKNSVDAAKEQTAQVTIHVHEVIEKSGLANTVVFTIEDASGGFSDMALLNAHKDFFTTKPQGDGNGIGLSIVEQFMRLSSGNLAFGNIENGAFVKLTFPAFVMPATQADEVHDDHQQHGDMKTIDLSGQQIIVLEDSEAILNSLVNYLKLLGASVISFNSLEAVKSYPFDSESQNIALMISDVNLTDGSGDEAIVFVKQALDMDFPCITMSGNLHNMQEGRLKRDTFLKKPFSLQELSQTLSKILLEKTVA